jgi:hypothetical protein
MALLISSDASRSLDSLESSHSTGLFPCEPEADPPCFSIRSRSSLTVFSNSSMALSIVLTRVNKISYFNEFCQEDEKELKGGREAA